MYHLLKGLHEYLTRFVHIQRSCLDNFTLADSRKEEFSVIIIGLDGAGKTVSANLLTASQTHF